MNILFAMASAEYVRFYDATIQLLAARGHRVLLAVNTQRDKKPVRLDQIDDAGGRVVPLGLVPERTDKWAAIADGLRGVMDFARYLHPRLASAPALRARMKRKALPRGFYALDAIHSLGAGGTQALLKALGVLQRSIPSSAEVEAFLREHQPDVVLVSPLVDARSDQVELVKAAQALGIPVGACIPSWDNLTNKGCMRVQPDAVILWNEAQKREAVEYHGVKAETVVVTGAQPFDRWFDRRPSMAREAFCAQVGLPSDRPFILYTCSSSFISISPAELAFVRSWIAAVRSNPSTREVSILIRPHPYNFAAWETAEFPDQPHVRVWPARQYNPMEEDSRSGFFDSLYYSAAVVGINTSAMIEAAILGRPVLSMLTPEFAHTQEGTLHFHYLLPENGGFLRIANTLVQHVEQLSHVMSHQEEAREETKRFVSSFIRPRGIDVACTPLVADAIEALGRRGRQQPQRTPAWAPVLWPVLWAGGVYGGAWWIATDPKAIRSIRKKASSRVSRARKSMKREVRVRLDRLMRIR